MQNMRDLLRGSLGRSLRDLPPVERLAAAWPVACGTALAARGRVDRLADGELTVVVEGPQWIEPLREMRAVLQSQLAATARVPLRAIHFVLETDADRNP